jgi:hypothetical protein
VLAGKGIIKREISQVLRELGKSVKFLQRAHSLNQPRRHDLPLFRDFIPLTVNFILSPSIAGSSAIDRSNERKVFISQATASEVMRLSQTLSASSDEWHASCFVVDSNHVPLGHWYSARVKQAVATAQNRLLTLA